MSTAAVRVVGGAGAAAMALAIGIATPFLMQVEGLRNMPYLDTKRIVSVCFGETRVPMRRYSDAECTAMLQIALSRDYGPAVLACTPAIAGRVRIFGSALSLAYNIGVRGYCQSTAARLFNAGRWAEGCRAYLLWDKPPEIQGRRRKEMALCQSGL